MGQLQSADFLIQHYTDDLFTANDLVTVNLDSNVHNCVYLNRIHSWHFLRQRNSVGMKFILEKRFEHDKYWLLQP